MVDGSTRVAQLLTELLRERGLRVQGGRYAADAALHTAPEPDLVVFAEGLPPGPSTARLWRARGIRHLAVVVEPAGAMVGPLVSAGGQPCLECLHLRGALLRPGPRVAGDATLAALTAALAAAVVQAALRGDAPSGVSLEVAWPWPRVIQRVWPAQPGCSCARTAAVVVGS